MLSVEGIVEQQQNSHKAYLFYLPTRFIFCFFFWLSVAVIGDFRFYLFGYKQHGNVRLHTNTKEPKMVHSTTFESMR